MQNFIVSARKYRPQTFDTVVGQASITNTLKNAILHNQLAQAFLFCGPRGVGKTTCARILAKTINCEHLSPNAEACNQCTSCVSFNDNASFNIYELDGASNNSVDDIRNLVDQVRIPPQMGKYKVYIIDEVHMLSASAFNAFLKTLEEPPSYTKFILATTEKHKIIPTILSRCQIFDFRRITVDDIAHTLNYVASHEHIVAEEDALHIIAQKADGAMRDALSIFDQLVSFAGKELTYKTVLENLNVLDYDYYFKITGQILNHDVPGTLLTLDEILGKGFDGQHFLIGFGEHIRNLLVCKDPATVNLLETAPTIRQRYLEQAADCPTEFLLMNLDIANKCDLNYKSSNNKRLHLELALLQLCTLGITAPPPPLHHGTTAPPNHGTEAPRHQGTTAQPVSVKGMKESLPGTISIKARQKPDQEAELEKETESTAESPFTTEDLNLRWKEFATTLQIDLPHLYTTLTSANPLLKENWQIEFELTNKILEEELNQKRGELLDFLKRSFNNYKITLQTKIRENQKEMKPYTDQEKFEKMAAKNPALYKLKEQLDLDIEY
ncbi:MAG: DNA polymerase III subunit gamma/tau [bacterium]